MSNAAIKTLRQPISLPPSISMKKTPFQIKRFRFEPDDAIEHQQAYSQIKLLYVSQATIEV